MGRCCLMRTTLLQFEHIALALMTKTPINDSKVNGKGRLNDKREMSYLHDSKKQNTKNQQRLL